MASGTFELLQYFSWNQTESTLFAFYYLMFLLLFLSEPLRRFHAEKLVDSCEKTGVCRQKDPQLPPVLY